MGRLRFIAIICRVFNLWTIMVWVFFSWYLCTIIWIWHMGISSLDQTRLSELRISNLRIRPSRRNWLWNLYLFDHNQRFGRKIHHRCFKLCSKCLRFSPTLLLWSHNSKIYLDHRSSRNLYSSSSWINWIWDLDFLDLNQQQRWEILNFRNFICFITICCFIRGSIIPIMGVPILLLILGIPILLILMGIPIRILRMAFLWSSIWQHNWMGNLSILIPNLGRWSCFWIPIRLRLILSIRTFISWLFQTIIGKLCLRHLCLNPSWINRLWNLHLFGLNRCWGWSLLYYWIKLLSISLDCSRCISSRRIRCWTSKTISPC